jgi:hypothetical protein
MNQKKAKGLRRLARTMVSQMNINPNVVDEQYRKMKKVYKAAKGQI